MTVVEENPVRGPVIFAHHVKRMSTVEIDILLHFKDLTVIKGFYLALCLIGGDDKMNHINW